MSSFLTHWAGRGKVVVRGLEKHSRSMESGAATFLPYFDPLWLGILKLGLVKWLGVVRLGLARARVGSTPSKRQRGEPRAVSDVVPTNSLLATHNSSDSYPST